MSAYTSLLNNALNLSQTPYTAFSGQGVAPINAQQYAGISGINQYANAAQPAMSTAEQMALSAGQPITAAQIQNYENPYTQQVVGATQQEFNAQNALQQQQVQGNAIAQGALGGNREAIAQAETANQEQLAQAPVIAGLESQGYTQGVNTALSEQQAAQAGAYGLSGIAGSAQNLGLTGAGAQIGAGTTEQQTQQAQDVFNYQQYLNQLAYPFQTEQYGAGIAGSLGSLMGGTAQTIGPPPNPISQALGLGTTLTGLFGSAGAIPFLTGSDRRVKENLHRIGKLFDGQTIYRFNYKGDPETRIGLVAQDVEHHHPDAVHEVHGIKHVDYDEATKDAIRRWHGGVANRARHFAAGGEVPGFALGGGQTTGISAFPYGAAGMPYGGGTGYVPTGSLARGPGPPRPPQPPQQPQVQGQQIGQMAKGIQQGLNAPVGVSPGNIPSGGGAPTYEGNIVTPANPGVSADMSGFGMGTDQSGLGWAHGGGVGRFASGGIAGLPTHDRIMVPRGYAEGGGPDFDQAFSDVTNMPSWAGSVINPTDNTAIMLPPPNAANGVLTDVPLPPSRPSDADAGVAALPPEVSTGRSPTLFDKTEDKYGLPSGYLARTAKIESGLNPDARNEFSGASGLFQFVPSTAKQYGLDDPTDPAASADAAGRLGRDNQQVLRAALGRDPTAAELYLAHQQGANGALALLANPNAPAASIVGRDAVLQNGGSLGMTAGQFANLWQNKFEGGGMPSQALAFAPPPTGIAPAAPPTPTGVAAASPTPAGIDWSGNSKLWPALTAAGLGMLASRSPFPGVAIGEGGLMGAQTYQGLKEQEQAAGFTQRKIDLEAKKLDLEAKHWQSELDLHTRPYTDLTADQRAILAQKEAAERRQLMQPVKIGTGPLGQDIYGIRDPATNTFRRIDPNTGAIGEPVTSPIPALSPTPTVAPAVPTATAPAAANMPQGTAPATPQSVRVAMADETPEAKAELAQILRQSGITSVVAPPEGGTLSEQVFQNPLAGKQLNDQALVGMTPGQQALVKMMVQGKIAPPSSFALARPFWQGMLQSAALYDPSFDAVNWTARNAAIREFTSGPTARNIIRPMNTLANHLNELEAAQTDLDNFRSNSIGPWGLGTQYANEVRNWVLRHQQDPRLTRVASASNAVNDEAVKAFKGSSSAAQAELDKWRAAAFDPTMARDAQHVANQTLVRLVKGQLDSVADQWDRAFGTTRDHISFLSPKAQEAYERIGGEAPTAAERSAPANDILSQARDAIARGAPRDAVIGRLRQQGIDPSGL
jgi:hypothetical protein